jgi:hypothetical protein
MSSLYTETLPESFRIPKRLHIMSHKAVSYGHVSLKASSIKSLSCSSLCRFSPYTVPFTTRQKMKVIGVRSDDCDDISTDLHLPASLVPSYCKYPRVAVLQAHDVKH